MCSELKSAYNEYFFKATIEWGKGLQRKHQLKSTSTAQQLEFTVWWRHLAYIEWVF